MTVDVSTPSDLEIRVSRTFDAPAHLVFEFHTVAAHVRRWLLGPPGWTMPVCEIDLRVGGGYHYVWEDSAGGTRFGFNGDYREISVPERLVHTERMDGASIAALCTLTFQEHGGRTTLTTSMVFPSKEACAEALASGMTEGMAQSYAGLDHLLAQ